MREGRQVKSQKTWGKESEKEGVRVRDLGKGVERETPLAPGMGREMKKRMRPHGLEYIQSICQQGKKTARRDILKPCQSPSESTDLNVLHAWLNIE